MIQMRIRLDTKEDINRFINILDADEYTINDGEGKHCISAKSLIGLLYGFSEFKEMYLRNETHDGHFPAALEDFRYHG